MLRNWWTFWFGFLRINIEGTQLEKFINLAASRGIPLYDLRRTPSGRMTARVRLDGFRLLRHVARKTNSRVRIEGRSGFPFFLTRVKRRKALVMGAFTFVLAIYMMSTFIWDVDVVGNERLDKPTILQAAYNSGVRPGRWLPMVNVREAERRIIAEIPGLEWVGIRDQGTRLIIEVQEKVLPNRPPVAGPSHIVAAKDGVIQRMIVLVGEGKVAEGTRVTKGQVLISGLIYAPPKEQEPQKTAEDKPAPLKVHEKLQAKGEAWARVWYEQTLEEPTQLEGTIPTGETSGQWRIKWGNQEIIIKGPSSSPFANSNEEVYTRTPSLWRNLQIPVELIKTEYHELRPYRQNRTPQEAITAAQDKARQALMGQLPQGAKVLREMVLPQPSSPDKVKVKVSIEALENIALPQAIDAVEQGT
ncbi:sporulation protein YqfD [Heliobacillus mobilis]|uniref:Sporulation protein YqfD n=1 Tax=Heliobacterium mobile TaxID=28064 RepID=A0A6I3SN09_HELMO|nr:sporulation protein YqfD [Heliobacterium mobile]MTV50146.1 sporulation protein YqfD [Heliobacterium mobile]